MINDYYEHATNLYTVERKCLFRQIIYVLSTSIYLLFRYYLIKTDVCIVKRISDKRKFAGYNRRKS